MKYGNGYPLIDLADSMVRSESHARAEGEMGLDIRIHRDLWGRPSSVEITSTRSTVVEHGPVTERELHVKTIRVEL